MSINLAWKDVGEVDRIKIYRSTSRMDVQDLPAPLATIDGREKGFLDVFVEFNTNYYYMVIGERLDEQGSVEQVVISNNLLAYRLSRHVGHGPTQLIRGDAKVGHFGILEPSEFFTNEHITQAINANYLKHTGTPGWLFRTVTDSVASSLNAGPNVAPPVSGSWTEVNFQWTKWIHNGKVLYIPTEPICGMFVMSLTNSGNAYAAAQVRTFSYTHLYRAGAVFGTDDEGIIPSGSVATPQDLVVEKDGLRYRVRLMKGTNLPTASRRLSLSEINGEYLDKYLDKNNLLTGSEYQDLYLAWQASDLKLSATTRFGNRLKPVDLWQRIALTNSQSTSFGTWNLIPREYVMLQEMVGADAYLVGNNQNYIWDQVATTRGANITTSVETANNISSRVSAIGGDRIAYGLFVQPVLELIEEDL